MPRFRRARVADGGISRAKAGTIGAWAWSAFRLAEVRLRVPIVLVIAALVVGRWDVLRNYWDRLTRRSAVESIANQAISSDTEYFCPMDPGIVSDWPGRCGVCNMALVRRKRGEAVMLPDGVVARMQLSPYRVQLAGIQTSPVGYRPLEREWRATGLIARDGDAATMAVEMPSRPVSWVEPGQSVEVASADLPGQEPLAGRVRSLVRGVDDGREFARATIAIDRPPPSLRAGLVAVVRFRIPVAAIDPFRAMPRDPPAVLPGDPRRVFVCPDHPETIAVEPGRCPVDRKEREPRALGELERLRWWCPMHPDVTADRPGASCRACEGMVLQPRVTTYCPAGQVLAVPQSAVVDTGARKVAFVEGMPGMFDGVEVVLGPRCGDFYPVVRGLEPGQRIATAGAFLLDAETRLNPSLAASYFGAGRGDRAAVSAEPPTGLGDEDRALAERQKLCPVTGMNLGSMGAPKRMVVSGRVVFLCCGACESKLLREPAKYLAKLPGSGRP
jgi:membrane fusion protein, copper/silver efflux system